MQKKKILIVDDEPDILDLLRLYLEEEYEVFEASDGEAGVEMTHKHRPDILIIDYAMPKLNGAGMCKKLREDALFTHLPIIMLTGKKEVEDKVHGIEAGADDYIVKPFESIELLARVKMILRRTERSLDANALTHLPGNITIYNEIEKRLSQNKEFAVCYIDIDKFKIFNDKYGLERGDEAIKNTARILKESLLKTGNPKNFLGHIGGDDFVIITAPELIDKICSAIITEFDRTAPNLYDKEDRKAGFIKGDDRSGNPIKTSLMSISIGVVLNDEKHPMHSAPEVGRIGAGKKLTAKAVKGSNYVT